LLNFGNNLQKKILQQTVNHLQTSTVARETTKPWYHRCMCPNYCHDSPHQKIYASTVKSVARELISLWPMNQQD